MDYPIEKIKLIQNYPDGDILAFLDEIKKSDERKDLNFFLTHFVPANLVNENNNAIKYGLKTKIRYI